METNEEKNPTTFNVGMRFEPIDQDFSNRNKNKTSESFIVKRHWAIVFTPATQPLWSLRAELIPEKDWALTFPTKVVEEVVFAHPIATWTGYLDDIDRIIQVHPMRDTNYQPAFNNCQHWVATFLVLLEAFSASTPQRQFNITHSDRHKKVLKVLGSSNTSLFHEPNYIFQGLVILGAPGLMGGAILYKNMKWRPKTMFADPRKHGYPHYGKPLSRGDGKALGRAKE